MAGNRRPAVVGGADEPTNEHSAAPACPERTALKGAQAMRAVFVQLQCMPGRTYEVADALYEREIVSELYSTSGEYDLLMKIYIEDESDIGKFINEHIAVVPGIVRSLTTLTFRAF
jgi:DNA-binding Lrp family transcriptional regulator